MARNRYIKVANWGAVEREAGHTTAQILRRLLGAAGDGRGGILESAVMNIFRTTNIYGGGSIPGLYPLRVIGHPPPQIIIGYNDATIWHHGVQSNGDYNIDRGGTVYFQLTSDGKLSINEPTDNALLNINLGEASYGPPDISNIYMWLEADDLAYTEGQDVLQWDDKSGVSNISWTKQTGVNTPIMRENAVNGHAAIESETGGDTLIIQAGAQSFPANSSFTCVFVFQANAGDFAYVMGAGNGSVINGFRMPNPGYPTYIRADQNGTTSQISTALTGDTDWHVGIIRRDSSGNYDAMLDGVDVSASVTSNLLVYWRNLFRGSSVHFCANNNKLAEVVVYYAATGDGGKISDEDRTALSNYLLYKYGLGGTAPAGGGDGLEIQNSAGTALVKVDTNGYLGIGSGACSSIDRPFHVQAASAQARFAYDGSNQLDIAVASDGDTDFLVNNTKVFTITSDGDLGLGIDPPALRLHVLDTGDPQVRVGYDESNYFEIGVESDGDTDLRVDGADVMTLQSGGNVGIGMTSPGTKLEIAGDLSFDGNNRRIYGRATSESYIEIYNSSTGDMTFFGTYAQGDINWHTENNATPKMKLAYGGNLGLGTGTNSPGGQMEIANDNAAHIGLVVTGAASQSAAISRFRWDNSNTNYLDFFVYQSSGCAISSYIKPLHLSCSTKVTGTSGQTMGLDVYQGTATYVMGINTASGLKSMFDGSGNLCSPHDDESLPLIFSSLVDYTGIGVRDTAFYFQAIASASPAIKNLVEFWYGAGGTLVLEITKDGDLVYQNDANDYFVREKFSPDWTGDHDFESGSSVEFKSGSSLTVESGATATMQELSVESWLDVGTNPTSSGTYPLNVDADVSGYSARFDGQVAIGRAIDTPLFEVYGGDARFQNPNGSPVIQLNTYEGAEASADTVGLNIQAIDRRTTGDALHKAVSGVCYVQDTNYTSGNVYATGLVFSAYAQFNGALDYCRLRGNETTVGPRNNYTGTVDLAQCVYLSCNANEGTITEGAGVVAFPYLDDAAGTITEYTGFHVNELIAGGRVGTLTTFYGLRVGDYTFAGTCHAIYIDDGVISSSATKQNIYFAGGDWNTGHLQLNTGHIWANGGDIGIKDAAPTAAADAIALFGATVKLGDCDGTDYTEVEADGTVVFNGAATIWDDMQIAVSTVRLPTSSAPSWQAYKGGQVLNFTDGNDEIIYFTAQLPHSYKEGSDIEFHIHVANPSTNSGNTRWIFTHSWANIGADFPAETTVTTDVATGAATTADRHELLEIAATISGTGKTISSVIICSLEREASHANDTYNGDIYLVSADFHFEKDTVGSRAMATK